MWQCSCELFGKKTVGTNYVDCSIELIKMPTKTRVQIQTVLITVGGRSRVLVEFFSMLCYGAGESCESHAVAPPAPVK